MATISNSSASRQTSGSAAAPGGNSRWITEALLHRDLWFAMAIMAVIAVLVIPMPAWLLDVGLAISITLSTLILLVAILTRRALDFSSFPTILLVATMIRLTLNLSSTRLIDAQASLGRYDRALEAADGAVLASADLDRQHNFRKRIGELLQSAFEASAAEGGDRINAIALFDRYGEMLPDETQRAALGLKLADQLAAADLDTQAAELLRQLKRTAPDAQQAAVSAKLAKIDPGAANNIAAAEVTADSTTATSAAMTITAPTDDFGGDPDSLWRDKRWSEAADGYLRRIADTTGKARPRLILRAAAALMLAGRNRELTVLGDNFGAEMKDTALADLFKQLTAPGADYSLLIAPDMAKALTVTQ